MLFAKHCSVEEGKKFAVSQAGLKLYCLLALKKRGLDQKNGSLPNPNFDVKNFMPCFS